ncbi:MAG: PHP domain-containing protein, partial [Candidatus Hydrothermarchaeales archaeon]
GVEVNIMSDNTLDLADDVLSTFDVVVAGVHTGLNQSEEKITGRIVSAMESEHVDIISHPTGRLIERRSPYEVDLEKIINVASETGTVLEINAAPQRLDLRDVAAMRAKERGVKVAISTDAHSIETLDYMRYGIATARRGWLEPKNVVNTLSFEKLMKIFS